MTAVESQGPNLIAASTGEEPIIQAIAEELAGQFHTEASDKWADDPERSARFRDTYPNTDDYIRGFQCCRADFAPVRGMDGQPIDKAYFRMEGSERWWKLGVPGWHYFVEIAVKRAAAMLNEADVSKFEKKKISDALIRRFNKATDPTKATELLQRRPAGKIQLN